MYGCNNDTIQTASWLLRARSSSEEGCSLIWKIHGKRKHLYKVEPITSAYPREMVSAQDWQYRIRLSQKMIKTSPYAISIKNHPKLLLILISGDKHQSNFSWKVITNSIWSGSALSDRSIQVEENTNRPLVLSKGWTRTLTRGENYGY